jgi:hypothetical protein
LSNEDATRHTEGEPGPAQFHSPGDPEDSVEITYLHGGNHKRANRTARDQQRDRQNLFYTPLEAHSTACSQVE